MKPLTGTFATEPKVGRWADECEADDAWPELITAKPKPAAKAVSNGKVDAKPNGKTEAKPSDAKPIEVKLHPVLSDHQNMTQHLIERASASRDDRPALHPVLKTQQDKTNELIKSLLQEG
jgi:hypothetical protein